MRDTKCPWIKKGKTCPHGNECFFDQTEHNSTAQPKNPTPQLPTPPTTHHTAVEKFEEKNLFCKQKIYTDSIDFNV